MFINDKVILITGGTGSFGNALISRLIKEDVKEIRVLSRDEKKQDDMRRLYSNNKLKFFIGDVRDLSSLDVAFKNVDVVFHAAAIKQVPSAEFFPVEAVKTNILGTENVLKTAINNNVSKVVCLSTDKAAYPINSMGISKAMMERVAFSMSRHNYHNTKIIVTRYGNVIGSRGSVIPLFISQAVSGKPLTVTSSEMTRFIMSLEEAIELVLYAFEFGNTGDLFVYKAKSAKVIDVAHAIKQMIQSESEIKFIGPRHSEKYHETLLTKEEIANSETNGDYVKVYLDNRTLDYNKYLSEGNKVIDDITEFSSNNTSLLSVDEIKKLLLSNSIVKSMLDNDSYLT